MTVTERPVVLLPGEMAFEVEPARISTLLGSCVAVCLFDRRRRWGGMNHFLLPRGTASNVDPLKYGNTATRALVEAARAAGSALEDLVASLYGGGSVLGGLNQGMSERADIGAKNIESAKHALERLGIGVVRSDVGGRQSRRIHMHTATNRIYVQHIAPMRPPAPGVASVRGRRK